jgi:hypothetical protein
LPALEEAGGQRVFGVRRAALGRLRLGTGPKQNFSEA